MLLRLGPKRALSVIFGAMWLLDGWAIAGGGRPPFFVFFFQQKNVPAVRSTGISTCFWVFSRVFLSFLLRVRLRAYDFFLYLVDACTLWFIPCVTLARSLCLPGGSIWSEGAEQAVSRCHTTHHDVFQLVSSSRSCLYFMFLFLWRRDDTPVTRGYDTRIVDYSSGAPLD